MPLTKQPGLKLPKSVRVTLHQEEDGTYWGESLDVPGAYTVGQTIEETLTNMKDAIFTHLEISAKESNPKRLKMETTLSAKLTLSNG